MTRHQTKKTQKKGTAAKQMKAWATKTREAVERKRYELQLPVEASSPERDAAGKRLAMLFRKHEALESERRETNAEFRETFAGIKKNMDEAATTFEKGTKLEAVEVSERLVVETNEVVVVRLDTGEIVETRTAAPEDRQEALDLDASGEDPEV